MFAIGSSLRDARLRRRLELAQVEAETHIRAKYLAALEDERFELLPHRAYARTFLRTYAAHLGLDPRLFLDEFDSRYPPEVETPVAPAPAARRPRRTRLALLLLPVGAVLAAVLAWQLGASGGERRAHGTFRPPAARTHRTTRPTVPVRARERPSARPRAVMLRLVARERSWVEARLGSPRGRLVLERTLEPGRPVRLRGRRLWLRLGSPWNLEATLNGARLRLPGTVGDVVVTPAGLRVAG